MATSKVTISTDEIHPKTPGGLRIAFTKNAGNKTAVALVDIDQNDYITRQQFEDNLPVLNQGIAPWVDGEYSEDAPVRKLINGIWYLFVSQMDNNTTEPSLTPALPPWSVGSNQYAGNWSSMYPFLLNDVVNQSGHLFISLEEGNTGHDPISSPDYWKDLGVNRGNFNPDYEGGYAEDDAVFYDGFSYSSNIAGNTFLPTDPGANAWDLIGDNPTLEPNTPKEITVADNTQLDGDAGTGWYYTIPFASYSAYGNYPDVRVYRSSSERISLDYTNTLSGDIKLPLPDFDDDGKTLYPYLIIITK